MTLLIHSMASFSEIILGTLEAAKARHIAEIGAEFGGTSQLLAAYAAEHGGSLTSIDPSAKPEFTRWVATCPAVSHVAKPSLEAIPELRNVDAWVIDGDHNYYTVYHELNAIHALGQRDGRPLLTLLHDVGWPSARRDSYYAPDRIPAEWRHEYDYEGGVSLDTDALRPNRGFRGLGQFAWATKHGGPRNGVLTAVEDFRAEKRRAGEELAFAFVPAVFGLGILFDSVQPWSAALAQGLLPYHDCALLRTLEENRLRNYLTVIEHQDRMGAAAAA